MSHYWTSDLADRPSFFGRIDPRLRFSLFLSALGVISAAGGRLLFGATLFLIGVMLFSVAASAKFRRSVLRALLALLPFGAFVVFLMSLSRGTGGPSPLLRGLCSLILIALFVTTMGFDELREVLRSLRVPSIFITLLGFVYRYFFLFREELEKMDMALKNRSFSSSRLEGWRLKALLIGQVLLRSYRRSEEVYRAMTARGYDGKER